MSPNGHWYVHLASGGGLEISLFDTANFPDRKDDGHVERPPAAI